MRAPAFMRVHEPMTSRRRHAAPRWTLADLVDFEALFVRNEDTVDAAQRRHFLDAIRPRLTTVTDAAERRRVGLRLWLEQRRADTAAPTTGQVFAQSLNAAGWTAFAILTGMGASVAAGLVLGAHQAVHVVIFIALALLLPWLVFALGALAYAFGVGRSGLRLVIRGALQMADRRGGARASRSAVLAALTAARSTRRVLWTEVAVLTQRAAVGFNLGLIVAFVACLLLFDVRFYWEATPHTGVATMLTAFVHVASLPWGWLWPQAVPGIADIEASRLLVGAAPVSGDGSWWRFLLLALLTWGLLPRLLLLAWLRHRARRALARLDLQTPRQRALWRGLSAVQRGEVATGPTDGALVLDVGGHGVTGAALRGFLLRRLRVNPVQTLPVAVLDENDEARAQQALAAGPAGVVLLVESRMLSPRQLGALHARLRAALGADVAMTWLVFALHDGQPGAVEPADMQRWARTIDSLRDPAAEVVAYDA